jgi:hypothetical protein
VSQNPDQNNMIARWLSWNNGKRVDFCNERAIVLSSKQASIKPKRKLHWDCIDRRSFRQQNSESVEFNHLKGLRQKSALNLMIFNCRLLC